MVLKNRKLTFPNFNFKEMRRVCSDKENVLAKRYGLTRYQTLHGNYWFKDNGSSILAVVHADTVQSFLHFSVNRLRPDTQIWCPTLDDRLGAYLILEWLQLAGLRYDILLTTNEEKGQSTAIDFQPPKGKQYNWMFMFDRTGDDVVSYQYRDTPLAEKLTEHGWKLGYGSYSCIRDLEDLGCKGMNFGTAYYNYHSVYAYASLNDLTRNLRRFMSFYSAFHSTPLPHSVKYNYTPHYGGNNHNRNQYPFNFDHSQYSSEPKSKSKSIPKTDKIKAALKKRKAEREAEERAKDKIKAERLKQAQLSFMMQDISMLNTSNGLISILEKEGICTIAELVRMTSDELVLLKGIDKDEIKNLERALLGIELKLGTDIKKEFDIEIREREVTETEVNKINNEVDKTEEAQGQQISPIPLSQPVDFSLMELHRDYESKEEEEVVKGIIVHTSPSKRDLTFKSAKRLVKMGQKVKVQDTCLKCGHNYQFAVHNEKEVLKLERGECCPECDKQSIKRTRTADEKGGPILTHCLLVQDENDKSVFGRNSNGEYGWLEKVQVGFTAPAK